MTRNFETIDTVRERERERELYSSELEFICDGKKYITKRIDFFKKRKRIELLRESLSFL